MRSYKEQGYKEEKMGTIRILSIDGGGIRGIIPATILVTFEQMLKERSGNENARLADYVDLIAGTSTGGILVALYMCPDQVTGTRPRYTGEAALQFYMEKGPLIFKKSLWHSIKSLCGLTSAKYSNKTYLKVMDEVVGDTKLSELLKPCLIPAYDIERRRAMFFNQMDPYKGHKGDFYIKDVVQATSAAPTYFEPAYILDSNGEGYSLIDGGVFANNPTLCAYAEASKLCNDADITYSILSLGTGTSLHSYPYQKAKRWGGAGWLGPLFSILLGGVAETVDYQVGIMGQSGKDVEEYLRIQAYLDENDKGLSRIDNVSLCNMEHLRGIGNKLVKENYEALGKIATSWVRREK